MSAIIEVQGLGKVYSRFRDESVVAVQDLDLVLGQPGTVHGFLGPNGSGKTTTIRCLLGLIRPTSGSVSVFGVDSTTEFHKVADRVGAIVENPKLFPPFSGRRNLQLLADMAGIASGEVDRTLEIVGLSDRAKDAFDSYSLGMKQRLAIAAAMLKDPDLLILDEPANGLDPAGIAEIRVLIRSIADEGKAVLVSSHQLAEIEQVCDQVTIIHHGHLVATGALDDIRTHAGPDLVVAEIDQRDGAISVLAAAGIVARPRPKPSEIVVDIGADQAATVTKVLADAGRYIRGLRTERATLEAAFLNLTGAAPPPPPATGAAAPAAGDPVAAGAPPPASPPTVPPEPSPPSSDPEARP